MAQFLDQLGRPVIDLLDVEKAVNQLRRVGVVIFEHPPRARVSNLFIPTRSTLVI